MVTHRCAGTACRSTLVAVRVASVVSRYNPPPLHSLRIYPYPLVWPLPRPWSETMVFVKRRDEMSTECEHDGPLTRTKNRLKQDDQIWAWDTWRWQLWRHDVILSAWQQPPFLGLSHEAMYGSELDSWHAPFAAMPQRWGDCLLPHEMIWADLLLSRTMTVGLTAHNADSLTDALNLRRLTVTKPSSMTWHDVTQPKVSLPELIVRSAELPSEPELLLPRLKLDSSTSIDVEADSLSLSSCGLTRLSTTVKLRSISNSVMLDLNSPPEVRRASMWGWLLRMILITRSVSLTCGCCMISKMVCERYQFEIATDSW